MGIAEIDRLPITLFNSMSKNITRLEAQEMLVAIKVATFDGMPKNDRDRLHRELMTKAYPTLMQEKKLTLQDLAGALANRG